MNPFGGYPPDHIQEPPPPPPIHIFNELLLNDNIEQAWDMLNDEITVNTLDEHGFPPLYAVLFEYYDEFIAYNWHPNNGFAVYEYGPEQYAPGPYPHEERILNSVAFLLDNGADPLFEVEITDSIYGRIANEWGNTALNITYDIIEQYINALRVGDEPHNTVMFNLIRQDGNPTLKQVYENGLETFLNVAILLIDNGALGDNFDLTIHDEVIEEAGGDINNPVWIELRQHINDIRNETNEERRRRRAEVASSLLGTMNVPRKFMGHQIPMTQREANLDARETGLSSLPPELAAQIASYETGEEIEGEEIEEEEEEEEEGEFDFKYGDKYETIKFNKGKSKGDTLRFKKGTLRRSLHMKKGETFTIDEIDRLSRIPIGNHFDFHDRNYKMTHLMKKRVDLAKTLMGFHHRFGYSMNNEQKLLLYKSVGIPQDRAMFLAQQPAVDLAAEIASVQQFTRSTEAENLLHDARERQGQHIKIPSPSDLQHREITGKFPRGF